MTQSNTRHATQWTAFLWCQQERTAPLKLFIEKTEFYHENMNKQFIWKRQTKHNYNTRNLPVLIQEHSVSISHVRIESRAKTSLTTCTTGHKTGIVYVDASSN